MNQPEDKLRYELDERLRFEQLIADLSSKFVNLPAGEVDRVIMEVQRQFCEWLDLDLAGLWQWSDEFGTFRLTHLYRVDDGPQPPAPMLTREHFPWFEQQLLGGHPIAISSMTELPPEAARDREVYGHFGIKSVLAVPLAVGGAAPVGMLGFNKTRAERGWPDALITRLQLIAQPFANALARPRSDLALRANQEQLSVTAARLEAGIDLAALGYYEVDYGERTCFLDERFRDICGVPNDVRHGLDPVQFWLEHIHPDDRQLLSDTRQRLHGGAVDRIAAEYRYLHPAKGLRWLHHSARSTGPSAGGAGIRTFGVVRDITERQRMAEQQAEDLRFMTLIAELSSRFVNLPAGAVDRGSPNAGARGWREAPGCFGLPASDLPARRDG